MKKTKLEKGITLVALIITIVVLLILAVVSIGAVRNSGIIGHATNTSDAWKEAQANEATLLAGYEAELKEQMGIGPWTLQEDGETIINGKTGETKTIGETFTNEEVLAATGGTESSYKGKWTIIGVENGKLKLVSTSNVVASVKLGDEDPNVPVGDLKEIFNQKGETASLDVEKTIWSYQHVVETLNNHAKKATGIENARSITIEDIETLLNITEEQKVAQEGNYGQTYKYFHNGTNVQSKWKAKGASETDEWETNSASSSTSEVFIDKQGNAKVVASENDEVELVCNQYNWYDALEELGFQDILGSGNYYYWLASPVVSCGAGSALYEVFTVRRNDLRTEGLLWTGGPTSSFTRGVRAVICI